VHRARHFGIQQAMENTSWRLTVQSGPDVCELTVYWQDALRKVRTQEFDGAGDASEEW
jgi:hypothetical protein